MVTLSNTDAIALVRKNLDEINTNSSEMQSDDYSDNSALDMTIKKNLPEAVNAIHLAAPVQLLEGESVTAASPSVSSEGVLSFSLPAGSKYLRLVAFQAADSPVVVTDTLPEAGPEGRKQLRNTYARGRYDRPRLVSLQGSHTEPAFKYYSLRDDGAAFADDPGSAISQLLIIKEQFYSNLVTEYNISRRLRQNIIDCLTAMVMETYNDQRAQYFFQKANNFPTI